MSKTPPKLPGRVRPARHAAALSSRAFADLTDNGRLRRVALAAIVPNPHQPRRHFDEAALVSLSDSIVSRGILQPPVVRQVGDTYELVAGERRWRAAGLAGLTEIEVLVSDTDDAGSLLDALVENVAREDLSPIEKARSYATIIEDLGLTREAVGQHVGESRVSISNHLRLLDLPDGALELVDRGDLSFAHGRALLLCDDQHMRLRLAREAVAEGWTTRQLEAAAHRAGAPRARRRHVIAADGEAFAQRFTDTFGSVTGLDVRSRISAAGAVTITLADQHAARALLAKLGAPEGALDEPSATPAKARPRTRNAK